MPVDTMETPNDLAREEAILNLFLKAYPYYDPEKQYQRCMFDYCLTNIYTLEKRILEIKTCNFEYFNRFKYFKISRDKINYCIDRAKKESILFLLLVKWTDFIGIAYLNSKKRNNFFIESVFHDERKAEREHKLTAPTDKAEKAWNIPKALFLRLPAVPVREVVKHNVSQTFCVRAGQTLS